MRQNGFWTSTLQVTDPNGHGFATTQQTLHIQPKFVLIEGH
jgi:hypothetical protein